MVRGPFLTVPNLITLTRVPLAVVAIWLMVAGHRTAAQITMVAAFATDALDGAVARLTKTTSAWGKVLDPMADKLVFAVFGVAFWWLKLIPGWFCATLVARDVLVAVAGFRHMGRIGKVPSSNAWGKVSTAAVAVYLFQQAFWPAKYLVVGLGPVGWVALVALLASTVAYGRIYLHHRAAADEPGEGADAEAVGVP